MPEFYMMIARKKYYHDFFWGGGRAPLPSSPAHMKTRQCSYPLSTFPSPIRFLHLSYLFLPLFASSLPFPLTFTLRVRISPRSSASNSLSKLLTYCVLRPTQPPTPSGTGNK